ncbi:MAG TPA: FAD-dependent oxidoreductase, partial [Terriglobales bacterium]|nr:FAD-dependent oxidoreductase [Terriglobales bacterium]
MRDVIVVGAGGGGAVVAKELAERGLDVLLLEAGPRFAHSEREWPHFENAVNNPATGVFRFGPGDRSKPPWARDLPQNCYVWQTAAVGGSTVHYFANSPRAMPGVFADYAGADARQYDRDHVFPFGYAELVPYYEWVEHTLPVQTA